MKQIFLAVTIFLTAGTVCAQSRTTFKNTQEAVRYYEELVGSLIQQVKLMQDDNATLQATVLDLKKQVSLLSAKMQDTDRELEALKKQVAADAETRKVQLKSLADKLSAPPPAAQTRSHPAPRSRHCPRPTASRCQTSNAQTTFPATISGSVRNF